MALNLRLMAYQPNGAFIGILPTPSSYDVGTILNDVSSLQVSYSDLATRSEIFSTPIEVAVEYSDALEWAWVEPDNGRFLLLDKDIDKADESKMASYTLPGYAWQLDKAVVVMSPGDRVKLSGKRSFKESSPGYLLITLINEAKARGVLSGLEIGFTSGTDSSGAQWRHDQSGLSFDAGTGYLKVLKSLSDAGLIDWCMRGRRLCVFNPNGELAAPRAASRAAKVTTSVNLNAFLDQVAAGLSTNPAAVAGPNPSDDWRAGHNILDIAQHGEPGFNPHGYELARGIDATQTQVYPSGASLALYSKGTPDDGIERATGAFAMALAYPMRYFYACPRMSNSTRPDLLAQNAFLRAPSGAILMAETDPSLKVEAKFNTGYTRSGAFLIDRGISVIEVDTFSASEFPTANVIVEGYPYNQDNGLRKAVADQLALQAFDVRSNVGSYKATILDDADKAVDKAKDTMDRAANAVQYASGGPTAAQRNALKVAQHNYNLAVNARTAIQASMASKNLVAGIFPNEYPASAGAMGYLGYLAHAKKVPYTRILVADSIATNPTWRNRFGVAVNIAMQARSGTQTLPFINPKGYVDDMEIADPTILSAVSLRMSRDIVEAPTKSSLTDLVSRVYAYGDGFSQVVVENSDAIKPWGIWEQAVASGGVDDTDTLQANAQVALDQGTTERVSMTRGVTFEEARFLPFRHYDTGDYVQAPSPTGEMVPMRIHQMTISMSGGALSGSLVMSDRFLPIELKRSKAIVAASGGAGGGTLTLGGGVRPVAPVTEVRKLTTPTPKS